MSKGSRSMEIKPKFWRQVAEGFRELNPEVILREADRPITVALVAEDQSRLRQMERFLAPPSLDPRKAEQVRERFCSFVLPLGVTEQEGLRRLDLVICSEAAASEVAGLFPRAYVFSAENPQAVVSKILKEHWDLALPLAKNFLPFRRAVARRSTRSIAMENAIYSVLAAVSDASPIPFSLLRVGGLASS